MLKQLAAALLMSLATAPHAGADESQPPMQTVEIKGNLDRLVPYKSPYYEMAREVESATGGRLVLGIQLSSLRPRERIDDIKLRLETDAEAVPVEVDKNGLFIVPMLDRMARRDDARFSVNRRKGTLVASGVLLPAVPKDAWTIGGVRQITSDLHTALAAVAPWYLKPMAVLKAWNRGVSVCAPRRGTSLKVVKGAATVATVPLDSAARDHANQAVFCHAFNGKETYEDSSRLVLPDEATVLLL